MGGSDSVDVIIAAHNAADTVARAIRSALNEERARCIYVVDDASADATVAVIKQAFPYEARLVVLELPKNRGPAAARNLAIDHGRSEWISVLDADDFFLPGRLDGLLDAASDADFVADDLQVSSDSGRSWSPAGLSREGLISFEAFARGNVSRPDRVRRELGFLKPLMRRSFMDRSRLRFDESLRLGEDYVLYAQALAAGCRFKMTRKASYVAVERADSLSGSHSTGDLDSFHAALNRIEQDPRLTPSDRRAAQEHRRSLRRRLDHRRALDAKAKGDYLRLAAALTRPDSALHILRDVCRTAFTPNAR